MIEGRHFRNVEARRRTPGEAIDRYIEEEAPKKRDARTRVPRLRWWKEGLGHLKLADITPALLVEQPNKLARKPSTKARPGARRSMLEEGEMAREFRRAGGTVNRYLAHLSHVLSIARREWHWVSRAISGWKSGVVSRYVHLAAEDAKDVLAKMNRRILGPSSAR